MAKMKYCASCEEARGAKHEFCLKCGEELVVYTDTCPKCRYQIIDEDGDEFDMPAFHCPKCGESLEVEEE